MGNKKTVLTVEIPESLSRKLLRAARKAMTSKSSVARQAIAAFLKGEK
jgi:predicted transcriptional regulator